GTQNRRQGGANVHFAQRSRDATLHVLAREDVQLTLLAEQFQDFANFAVLNDDRQLVVPLVRDNQRFRGLSGGRDRFRVRLRRVQWRRGDRGFWLGFGGRLRGPSFLDL